jgi:hypothetical protein
MSDDAADSLDELITRLEGAAGQLRSGELSTDAAATLVDECAALANRAGAELERRARDGGPPSPPSPPAPPSPGAGPVQRPGQDPLL